MSRLQMVALWIAVLACVACVLFVPVQKNELVASPEGPRSQKQFGGYDWIWSPSAGLETSRLIAELFAVSLLGGAAVATLKPRRPEK